MHDTPRAIPWLDPSPAVDDSVNQVRAPAAQRATRPRLNLNAIESSLRRVQRAFPEINARLQTAREPLSDEVIANLMAGYEFIGAAIADGLNLEAHFYGHNEGSIGRIIEWYAGHQHRSPWRRAAGVYIRILSEPQLYIEGNHRCGALIISYLLAREHEPPFVLTVDNAKAYFDPSMLIKGTRKTSFALLFKLPHLGREFARFLKAQADERYLL